MDIETNTYAGPVRIEASNLIALLYFVFCNTLTLFGLYLSTQASTVLWISGQITLALAFMQWFIILHEAGHGTFFKSKHLNTLTGHYASVFAFIPFLTWRSVHNSHHKWTGWQDIDLTTASLVPRELSRAERFLFNNCWRFCIPIFSVIYRITNFWNLVRVRQFLSKQYKRSFVVNSIFLALIYIFIFSYFNFPVLFETLGLALFISLFLQENIIVSQHTHIPMRHSGNQSQRPFSCKQQVVFTRSLR
ncbi:MAG: fatty acid desaturase, partial [Gammaproteobacteria bacterium]|nr:fatty acid desaturase [Gammaproteobacteria bacterium]